MAAVHGTAAVAFDISPGCFRPRPKVVSSMLTFRANRDLPAGLDMKFFRKVVKTAFGKRRKTLKNSLADLSAADGRAPDIAGAGIAPDRRPETLSPAEFVSLTNHLAVQMR
jgi:16S rRNA (adenine1518-N6/adenine1519-N6)-dimethyltransferase